MQLQLPINSYLLITKLSSITIRPLARTMQLISSLPWTHYTISSLQEKEPALDGPFPPGRSAPQLVHQPPTFFSSSSVTIFSPWVFLQLGVGRFMNASPKECIPLLQTVEEACGDIAAEEYQGWISHARWDFPHCLAKDNIACDVNETLHVAWKKWKAGCSTISYFLAVCAKGLSSFSYCLFYMKNTFQIQMCLLRCPQYFRI